MNTEWTTSDAALVKNFEFADFDEAITFINKVAKIARKLNHHPQIINTYNNVTLKLSTHEAGNAVTEKDRELASQIDLIES